MRRLISAGGEIAAIGYDTELSADEALQKAQQRIMGVASRQALETGGDMEQSANEFMDFMDSVLENRTGVTGIPTGLTDLDSRTGGLHPGELIIIAGRPGTGKTTAALNIGLAVAKQGKEVAMFELEMTRPDLVKRMVSRETGIDFQQIRTGKLNNEQIASANNAIGNLSSIGFFIDDAVPLDIMQLGVKAHKRKAHAGLDLLIVDYLQLMKSTKRGVSREQEVAEVSQGLKLLAKSLNVPLIACAQLNRAVENRPNGKAQLSDLRESGQIENDADIVMFIHRDEGGPQSVAELVLAKHRNGPPGDVQVYYDAATMTFDNLYRR
jgi:replicative DNA helicase